MDAASTTHPLVGCSDLDRRFHAWAYPVGMSDSSTADPSGQIDDRAIRAAALLAMLASIRKALRSQANDVQNATSEYLKATADSPNPDVGVAVALILAGSLTVDSFQAAYASNVTSTTIDVYETAAQAQYDALGIQPFDSALTPSDIADIEAHVIAVSALVFATVSIAVSNIIQKGLDNGDSIEVIMQAVADVVNDPHQAMRIAETESTAAVNGGVYFATEDGWQMGMIVGKTWNTIVDGRERLTHLQQNGQTVPFGGRFANGGRFPGDPQLPASEVVNCRCSLTMIPYGSPDADQLIASLIEGGERWVGTLAEVNTPTSDGRILMGDVTWRTLPLPLFFQPEQDDAHDGAVQVGVIDQIEVVDSSVIGYGYLFPSHPLHDRALEIIESGSGQLSVDPAEAQVLESDSGLTIYLDPVLSGVTMTAGPAAFDSTRISLVAAAIPATSIAPGNAETVLLMAVPEGSQQYLDLTTMNITDWPSNFASLRLNTRSRSEMPVVESDQAVMFLAQLVADGIYFSVDEEDPRSIAAGQNELDASKVASMVRAMRDGSFDWSGPGPIISSDYRLIDGHHRWAAATIIRHADEAVEVDGWDLNIVEVDMAWPDLIAYADEFHMMVGNQAKPVDQPVDPSVDPSVDPQEDPNMSIREAAIERLDLSLGRNKKGEEIWPRRKRKASIDNSLVSGGGVIFDAAAFGVRKFSKPTPLTVDPDGNVFGHAALWAQCHRGISGHCQLVPRDDDGYKNFHQKSIQTTAGPMTVGVLTANIGHASYGLSSTDTMAHYDNTKAIWAVVKAYDDKFGVVVVGRIMPDLTEVEVTRVAGSLSGDWRKISGRLRLVAMLTVPVPGFAIVASGAPDSVEDDLDVVQATFGLFEDGKPVEMAVADETCAPCAETRAVALERLMVHRRKAALNRLAKARRAEARLQIARRLSVS